MQPVTYVLYVETKPLYSSFIKFRHIYPLYCWRGLGRGELKNRNLKCNHYTANTQFNAEGIGLMRPQLLQNLALKHLPVSFLRRRLARMTTEASPSINADKQLLIDVSVISKADAGTGIQRVVRNLYQELLAAPPAGYRVCPVAATRKQGYCYLPTDFLQQPTKNLTRSPAASVQICAGDLFLGLDLAAHIVPHRIGELLGWKREGVRMCFFVYDLLPVLEPAWFNPKTTQNFRRWLRAMAILADEAIAISRTVQIDFAAWMQNMYDLDVCDVPCATIQLGAELHATNSRQSKTDQPIHLPSELTRHKFILMVGTIEPRKGHTDVLDAFEQLWSTGDQTNLVIAGNQGWKVEPLIHRLQTHPEAGKRLHWLNSPSDEVLLAVYQNCSGVIMASKGEGLGLPLIEAAYFNKSVLARDIPVFREIAGNAASYFSATGHNNLMQALPQWLTKLKAKDKAPVIYPSWVTWQDSCAQLVHALLPPTLDTRNQGQSAYSSILCITNIE